MKNPTQKLLTAVISAASVAALAAFVNTSQGQVTHDSVTNGLVSYYPLTSVDSANTTHDLISRRDMTLVNMNSNNVVSDTHPGIESSNFVFDFPNPGSPTVLIYQTTGFDPLTGSGDYLPFINQRGATMNFWIKGAAQATSDLRVYGECANNGDSGSFFSLSDQPTGNANQNLGVFLRLNGQTTDPNGTTVNQLPDGTYELPSYFYVDSQSSLYCTNTIFDNAWHMFTMTIASNGDAHCFVDGNYDPGNQVTATTDSEGNPAFIPPLATTNTYYTTNDYMGLGSNPPPNGFVRWVVPGLVVPGAFTTIGGYDRNGGIVAGPPCRMSDFAFWTRVLNTNEIQFVYTNGVEPIPENTNIMKVLAFYPNMPEVGQGNNITVNWQVSGVVTNLSITGIGTGLASSGSVTVPASANQTYTFSLVAQNGLVVDVNKSFSVKVLAGVGSDWKLIQRFDGVYQPTSAGIGNFPGQTGIYPFGGTWFCLSSIFSGNLDRFNVVSLPTGGQSELVLTPKSGYFAGASSFGYDTRGAIAYGYLNGLSVPPYETHTAFFRFAVRNPGSLVAALGLWSGLDFGFGLTDFGFATGPLGGTAGAAVVGAGTIGPGFKITANDTTGNFTLQPFDLVAADYTGSNYLTGYDYMTDGVNGNANGLQTNATYMVWMDVSNDNTHQVIPTPGTTNTANEPKYGVWLQGPGQASPVQLFSGFGGNRDWSTAGQNNDNPTNLLNKVFCSVASEDFLNGDSASFFETNNMIVLDDFYLTKTGYSHSLPRPLAVQSVVRSGGSATIKWYSLGSLFETNTYSVQRTTSVGPGAPTWTTIATGVPSGGDFTQYTDSSAPSPVAFYRITWP